MCVLGGRWHQQLQPSLLMEAQWGQAAGVPAALWRRWRVPLPGKEGRGDEQCWRPGKVRGQ